jgi:hypothetical protein
MSKLKYQLLSINCESTKDVIKAIGTYFLS